MEVFRVGISPHIRHEDSSSGMMLDVCIALLPAWIWGVYVFGLRALIITLLSVLFSVGFEALGQLILKKTVLVSDLSAVVSGLIFAMCLPVSVPLWIVPIGAGLTVIPFKMLFGGLGKNYINPVAASCTVLFTLLPKYLTRFTRPFLHLSPWKLSLSEAELAEGAAATPLEELSLGTISTTRLSDLLTGSCAGTIGEGSALLLLAGLLYLLVKRVVTWQIPVFYLGSVALLSFFFPLSDAPLDFMLRSLLSGSLIFGAAFMATDPVTSPVTRWGKPLFAILCGTLTFLFRRIGIGTEAVFYAIALINLSSRPMDRLFRPRAYGTKRFQKRKIPPSATLAKWRLLFLKRSATPLDAGSEAEGRTIARVLCVGGSGAKDKYEYEGIRDCFIAASLAGGNKLCRNGCEGLGNCARACRYGAMHVENGVAVVDEQKCRGCGECVEVCPKNIVTLLPAETPFSVLCRSDSKGVHVIRSCETGCIGCKKCEKVCEKGAIRVQDFYAAIDPKLCTACGACAEACPRGIIRYFGKQ